MTFEQIQTLMNYGFTAEQIMILAGNAPPDETPPEETNPDETPPEEVEVTIPDTGNTIIAELRDEIKSLKTAMQEQNLKTQTIETIPNDGESVETILAGIIRPVYETKEETK